MKAYEGEELYCTIVHLATRWRWVTRTVTNIFLHRYRQIRVFFFLHPVVDLLHVQALRVTAATSLPPVYTTLYQTAENTRRLHPQHCMKQQGIPSACVHSGVSNHREYADIRPVSIRFMFYALCCRELRTVTWNTSIFRKWTCYCFWFLWKVTVNCRVYLMYTVIQRCDMKINYSYIHRNMRIYKACAQYSPHNVLCINTDVLYTTTHWISILLFVATKWKSVVNTVYMWLKRNPIQYSGWHTLIITNTVDNGEVALPHSFVISCFLASLPTKVTKIRLNFNHCQIYYSYLIAWE
jgi:hypothetical protein